MDPTSRRISSNDKSDYLINKARKKNKAQKPIKKSKEAHKVEESLKDVKAQLKQPAKAIQKSRLNLSIEKSTTRPIMSVDTLLSKSKKAVIPDNLGSTLDVNSTKEQTGEVKTFEQELEKKWGEQNESADFEDLENKGNIIGFVSIKDTKSIFHDTDLIVLKDTYTGPMPLRGIKQKDLNEIEKIFISIENGTSNLKIAGPCKEKAIKDIKILLTREIGRKIIKALCMSKIPIKVNAILTSSLSGEKGTNQYDNNTITIDYREDRVIGKDALGKRKFIQWPSYIRLGHEMVHAVHDIIQLPLLKKEQKERSLAVSDKDIMSHEWSNLREQVTIGGLAKNLTIDTPSKEDIKSLLEQGEKAFDPIDPSEYYFELNENNLAAAFANPDEKWQPRQGHGALSSYATGTVDVNDILNDEKYLDIYLGQSMEWSTWTDIAEILNNIKPDSKKLKHFRTIEKYVAVFKDPNFCVSFLEWNPIKNMSGGFNILEKILKQTPSDFWAPRMKVFRKLKRDQLEQFFSKIIVDIVKLPIISMENSKTFQGLFGSAFLDAKTMAKHLAEGYSSQEIYLLHLVEHPDCLKNLSPLEQSEAQELISQLIEAMPKKSPNIKSIIDFIGHNDEFDDFFKIFIITHLEKPEFSHEGEQLLYDQLFKDYYLGENMDTQAFANDLAHGLSSRVCCIKYLIDNPLNLQNLSAPDLTIAHKVILKLLEYVSKEQRQELSEIIKLHKLEKLFPVIYQPPPQRKHPKAFLNVNVKGNLRETRKFLLSDTQVDDGDEGLGKSRRY